jgi:hypothetical protein
MTGHALYFFVPAAQRIAGLAVIKFQHGADRPPTGGGVAIFAGNCQWAVRVAGSLLLGISGGI